MTGVVGAPAAVTPRWYAHGLNRAPVYRAAATVAAVLPRRARLALAARLADLMAARFPAERAVVAANVARIRPGASAGERARLVRAVFRHFAMCFADLVAANRARGVDRLLAEVEGADALDGAAAGGRGVIVVTAHLGNWELGGRLLARRLDRFTHVVVAAEADPRVEAFLRGGDAPVRFHRRGAPADVLPLLPALRRGDVVAMQGDRALGTRGDVAVPFFGVPAAFPLGPFLLARAAGVAVVPAFCTLEGDRRYRVRVEAPIEVAPGAEDHALARWVAALEAAVTRYPEQWFNFFDVWSTPPAH